MSRGNVLHAHILWFTGVTKSSSARVRESTMRCVLHIRNSTKECAHSGHQARHNALQICHEDSEKSNRYLRLQRKVFSTTFQIQLKGKVHLLNNYFFIYYWKYSVSPLAFLSLLIFLWRIICWQVLCPWD